MCSCTFTLTTGNTRPKPINQVNVNVTNPYAYLAIQVQQEPNSFKVVTEIDPFDIAEMLGNIGGFWGKFLGPSKP